MSVLWQENVAGGTWLGAPPSFSFFEPSHIEIPAPLKYQYAQEYRIWLLRDKGPDWYLWNALTAHHFYTMKKTEWWRTFV